MDPTMLRAYAAKCDDAVGGSLAGRACRELLQFPGSAQGDLGAALVVLHPAFYDPDLVSILYHFHFMAPQDDRDLPRPVLQSSVPNPGGTAATAGDLARRFELYDGRLDGGNARRPEVRNERRGGLARGHGGLPGTAPDR